MLRKLHVTPTFLCVFGATDLQSRELERAIRADDNTTRPARPAECPPLKSPQRSSTTGAFATDVMAEKMFLSLRFTLMEIA